MTIEDRRTEDQKQTHTHLVIGYDSFMSGWGKCENDSYACWACREEDVETVKRWVLDRKDLGNVHVSTTIDVGGNRGDHFSIYPVTEGHCSLQEA